MKIEFGADKVRINGPKIDGSYSVTLETGEYEQEKVAELLRIPQQVGLKVTVEFDDGERTTSTTAA